jgi:TolB protein
MRRLRGRRIGRAPILSMNLSLRLCLGLALCAAPLFAQRNIGDIVVNVDAQTIPVRVSATTRDLDVLARQAFGIHGRYKLVSNAYRYDIRFTPTGPTQVRVDITRAPSGTVVAAEMVSGTSARNALLRAADVAVAKTSEQGLRGFFTARLAFIAERTGKKEIYTSDLFLGEAKLIQPSNHIALSPRWSPDGSKLIYTSYYKSGFPDIFVYDIASYQRTTFVSFRGTNSSARFSPSGQQVAMVLSGEGNPEIYVSDAHGRNVSRKTRSDAVKSSPCWNANGTEIVFAQALGTSPQLYVIPASGGVPRRLVSGFSYTAEPDWNRTNPNKIACTVSAGGRYQIAVYDFSQGKAAIVSQAAFDGIEPSWLADGRHVVYTARDKSTSVLRILDTETGKSAPISPLDWGAQQASVWTPAQ